VYWTTSNAWQIGQQYFMLKSRPTEETLAEKAKSKPAKPEKKGFMSGMVERAAQERQRREAAQGKGGTRKPGTPKPGTPKPGTPKSGRGKPESGGSGGGGDPKKRPKR
jgi:YidC/Oxa1 family membrane protein insertase